MNDIQVYVMWIYWMWTMLYWMVAVTNSSQWCFSPDTFSLFWTKSNCL